VAEDKSKEESLLQLYRLDGNKQRGSFVQYGKGLFAGHQGSINDLAWAPLAGRTFHMIVSADNHHQIIVWKMVTKDVFDHTAKFENPKVEQMYAVSYLQPNPLQPQQLGKLEILRLKWNLTGTCFAGSCEDGTVRLWQRGVKQSF
jgi:WD40 repeat protein